MSDYYCQPVLLPEELRYRAALSAIRTYPPNAPLHEIEPARIAVLTSKWWGPGPHRFTVSFMEQQSQAFINKVLAVFNTWRTRAHANVEFVWTQRDGQCRIATGLGDGYYSYLGQDNEHIPPNQHTMSLSGFTVSSPNSEWLRVPPHECGHFLGCPHEQQRHGILDDLDPERTIALFMQTQGWSRDMVISQILVPIEEWSLTGASPADPSSLMCYSFPASITRSGRPIPGGADFTPLDIQYISRIYPLPDEPPPPPPPPIDPPKPKPTGGKMHQFTIEPLELLAIVNPATSKGLRLNYACWGAGALAQKLYPDATAAGVPAAALAAAHAPCSDVEAEHHLKALAASPNPQAAILGLPQGALLAWLIKFIGKLLSGLIPAGT